MEHSLENIGKDVLFLLGLQMKLVTLLNFCASSKRINEKLYNLWTHKIKEEFESESNENFLHKNKNKNKTPKEKYVLLYCLRDMKEKLKLKLYESSEEIYNSHSLNLFRESLTEIPSSIGHLFNLQELYLNDNKLTKIPASLGNLFNLRNLSLSCNYLKKIPDTIGNLTNLKTLHLYNNELEEIPATIENLSNLKYLDLQNNKLIKIPSSLEKLNLTFLDLSGNRLKMEDIPISLKNKADLNLKI
jgi:hypothetical protein